MRLSMISVLIFILSSESPSTLYILDWSLPFLFISLTGFFIDSIDDLIISAVKPNVIIAFAILLPPPLGVLLPSGVGPPILSLTLLL